MGYRIPSLGGALVPLRYRSLFFMASSLDPRLSFKVHCIHMRQAYLWREEWVESHSWHTVFPLIDSEPFDRELCGWCVRRSG